MKIQKTNQMSDHDFNAIRNTELYASMVSRKYYIQCVSAEECIALWQEITDHCRDVWYFEKAGGLGEEYNVYFSSDLDESIVLGVDERQY